MQKEIKLFKNNDNKDWTDLGWYHNLINEGYIFSIYCGRFRKQNCLCSACRSKRLDKTLLIQILEKCKEKI